MFFFTHDYKVLNNIFVVSNLIIKAIPRHTHYILVTFLLVSINIYFIMYLKLCIHEGATTFIWIVIFGPNFFVLEVKAELRIQTIYRQRFSSRIKTYG